eukprot:TRINITY_DN686_c0_g1_i2.p1 TRINITY_DN686_c0_g1~~TRINITY_DN686_c0_g1_i2.p1  ORF type:complete len:306 (-),score=85.87 TRINITY_DN686_c0_g1_i2:431-1309(-)
MSNGAIVAVTGASGYIAGSVIASLLERGYKVRGTVRALANADKTAHLRERFPGIELFEADLLKDGSFKACFEGADYVMHTASPFQLQVQDPQKDLIDPALHGTENVVSTALATPSVKRIVVTSSVAAVVGEERKEGVYTEEDWNMDSSLELNPYRYSKRLAEKRAWALVEEQQRPEGAPRVTLTCINPSFVLGPPHSERSDSTSVAIVKAILNGSMKVQPCPMFVQRWYHPAGVVPRLFMCLLCCYLVAGFCIFTCVPHTNVPCQHNYACWRMAGRRCGCRLWTCERLRQHT